MNDDNRNERGNILEEGGGGGGKCKNSQGYTME